MSSNPGTGIAALLGSTDTVSDSTITAGDGFAGSGILTRSRITATTGVLPVGLFSGGTVTVDDSLLRTVPGSGSETAVLADGGGVADQVTARHDTLVGDGSSGSVGVLCSATGTSAGPGGCSTSLESSIIRGFAHAISRNATGGPKTSATASAAVSVDYSDLDPATTLDAGNTTSAGGGTASGSITLGAHDVNVDPAFASTSLAAANAFQLTRISPVIDKGNPTLGSSPAESATDLAGRPRAVAGRAGGAAVSDIGAFEYQPQAPTVTGSVSPVTTTVGHAVQFTATASDPAPPTRSR